MMDTSHKKRLILSPQKLKPYAKIICDHIILFHWESINCISYYFPKAGRNYPKWIQCAGRRNLNACQNSCIHFIKSMQEKKFSYSILP